jgi:hypothetical protein
MSFSLRIRPNHILETAADFSVNIAAGLFITAFVVRDPWVLTVNVVGVTLFLFSAVALKARANILL